MRHSGSEKVPGLVYYFFRALFCNGPCHIDWLCDMTIMQSKIPFLWFSDALAAMAAGMDALTHVFFHIEFVFRFCNDQGRYYITQAVTHCAHHAQQGIQAHDQSDPRDRDI